MRIAAGSLQGRTENPLAQSPQGVRLNSEAVVHRAPPTLLAAHFAQLKKEETGELVRNAATVHTGPPTSSHA